VSEGQEALCPPVRNARRRVTPSTHAQGTDPQRVDSYSG